MITDNMTFKGAYDRIYSLLENVPDRKFDCVCIFEQFIAPKEELYTHPDSICPEKALQMAVNAAHRRSEGYPLQYILGEWEFYGLSFKVGEGVLIPRPETEFVVDEAIRLIDEIYRDRKLIVADLCAGTGCIAISIAGNRRDKVKTFAVEYSGDAFPYLVDNIGRHSADVTMIRGDVSNGRLLDNFVDDDGEETGIDLIVSNPPYLTDEEMNDLQKEITFEPDTALYGGSDGLKFYRVISALWGSILNKGGAIVFEACDNLAPEMVKILEASGFENINTVMSCGHVRALSARKK